MRGLTAARLALMALIVLVIFCTECGRKKKSEKVLIGVLKMSSNSTSDAVEKGIQDELAEEGYAEVTYSLQNARGGASTARYAAKKFRDTNARFAVGIGIQSARILKENIKDRTIIFSAVTDPIDAGFVESAEKGSSKIAGVSDRLLFRAQLKYFRKIVKIKNLVYIYNPERQNSESDAKQAAEICTELGVGIILHPAVSSFVLKRGLGTLAGRCEAVFIREDRAIEPAYKALSEFAVKNRIALFCSETQIAERYSFLAAWGVDNYKIGRATGKVIARIISGEGSEEIPVVYITDPLDADTILNLDIAAKLGITIDSDVIDQTAKVVKREPEKEK